MIIATPCYSGMLTLAYHQSVLALQSVFEKIGMPYAYLHTDKESLIQRARNTAVAKFLKEDDEHLFFIDADIEFTPDDVAKLWNLDADIAVAAYPMKRIDAPVSAWKDNKLVNLKELKEPCEVDFAGTGFMMIKRHVFEKFVETWPERQHAEGHVGWCYSWFDPRVSSDGEAPPKDLEPYGVLDDFKIYYSEDYAFSLDARELGFKIMLDPSVRLHHWGTYRYGS